MSENERMDGKKRHPFAITCRRCGSNNCVIKAWDYHSLDITCKNCGASVNCGYYDTMEGDYSE